MLDKINVLREKLETQILTNDNYKEILRTSILIDELLVEHYKAIQTSNLKA